MTDKSFVHPLALLVYMQNKLMFEWIDFGKPHTGWIGIGERPLLILVGLTGVGKTTTVNALQTAGMEIFLLPNRRTITDAVLIREMQRNNGEPVQPVQDRTRRFAYTRQYREHFPGGMAHALSQMMIKADVISKTAVLLFDGLRGANEVIVAAQQLPHARFLFLDAPNFVRLQRLLTRNDVFDQVQVGRNIVAGKTAVILDPTLTTDLLTSEQATMLNQQIESGQLTLQDVTAKLTIVKGERQNYDPQATLTALQKHAPQRLIYADTTSQNPAEIARLVGGFIERG